MDPKAMASRSWLRRYVLWPAVAVAVYAIIGFLVLPPIVQSVLVKRVSEALHRPVAIRAVRINPFVLSARVEGFSMEDRGGKGPFVAFEELYLNLQAASLYRWGPVLREIILRSPRVTLVRYEDTTYNFSDLLGGTAAGKPSKEGKPLRYSLNNIRVIGGSVDFDDRPKHTRHTVRDLSLAIPFLSNLPHAVKIFVRPSFEALVNGTAVDLEGETLPYSPSRETILNLDIRHFEIPHYLEYIPVRRKFDIPSGTLDARIILSFLQPPGESSSLVVSGTMGVDNLVIRDHRKAPVLRLPSLSGGIESLEPLAKRLTLDNVVVTGPELSLVRAKRGLLNVVSLLPGRDKEAQGEAGKAAAQPPEMGKEKVAPREWLIRVKNATLHEGSISAVDRTPPDPVNVKISSLSVTAENLSTEKDSRGQLSLSAAVNRNGKVAVDGSLTLKPLSAELEVNARAINLVPFQPYTAEWIKITLTGGKVSTNGRVVLKAQDNRVRMTYAGKILVSKLATIDKLTSEDFLTWDSLHLAGVRVATSPLSVAIREVALTDFYSRLIVTSEGTLNVQKIVREEKPVPGADNVVSAKPPNAARQPTPVSIQLVTLQGGQINFTDHFIKPNYSANFLEVGGRISGLSSEEKKMADVDLRGKLENYAPLEITGKINPLRNDLFVDLSVDFKNMDLSPLTPYSGRYVGYTIEKGKLSLSLEYLIANKKLDASNNIYLDQFHFGESVDSPEATNLPVRLAVALLKNRQGEIHLDLPVTGSLDDPQFSLWGVIIKIIKNLLIKVATSPFALLGSLFGGGEELSYLEFHYGQATLDPPAKEKLDKLAKALYERPALKLEVAGYVDKEKDREALRQSLFDRKIRAQKLKDLVAKGGEVPSLDNIVVSAKEYPKYLKRAYRAEKFPKPRNFIGMLKDLPVPEMEKLMFTNIQVTDDDLRLLAQRRAKAAKDSLLATKQVEPERIFLLEPKTLVPEKKEKQQDSRVEFVLK